jgi:iron complex outermembrane recepter protein
MDRLTNKAVLKTSVATLLVSSALGALTPAIAQTAPAAAPTDPSLEEIVVTGSLIANPNIERSAPVNVTTSEEIQLRQVNNAEEILREIPGAVPSIGSAVNNGNGGASFVDLRGLGSNRNIVLVDGNRMVPSGLVGRFDLNNIPVALVERVDVLTGGASTTYGADAISGVVNFITKHDFAGVEINTSEQLTGKGDGNVFRTDVTLGANFDDGRGNATFSIGYQKANPVYQGDREFSINNIDSYSGTAGGSTTAVPALFSFQGGGLPATSPVRLTGNRQFDPALGGVRPQSQAGTYAPFNFNPYNIFQTPFKRFNMFASANYEVADGFEVYTRGIFSKNTVNTIIAPSGSFAVPVVVPVSNAYLPVTLRNQFCANQDFNLGLVGIQPLTQAQCDAAATAVSPTDPNYREFTTSLRRRTVEVGPRVSEFTTTFFDYQAGVRGDITSNIKWDVAASYGESENIQTQKGYTLNSRFIQAVRSTNTTTCLNATNGCVPVNVFGPLGSITPAMIPFLTAESTTFTKVALTQVRGVVSGDTGFKVPMAEDAVSFGIGAEYRKYRAQIGSDSLSASGDLGGSGGATPPVNGSYQVKEFFAEVVAPIVQDAPFAKSLTVEAGIRYSSYNVEAAGNPSFNTTTWKGGASWEPVDGYKLRGTYARAVRAPNISELFSPVNTTLTNLGTDPCAGAAPTTNAELRAVCLAQGAQAFQLGTIAQPAAGQANSTGGGNLKLKPEKSKSYTIGLVAQPAFLSNFSMTLDYYNIKVEGAITQPTPADAISACFGANPTNPPAGASTTLACTQIRRNPLTGALDGLPSTTPGLFLSLSNLGTLKTDGVDLSLNWKHDIGAAKLTLAFTGNYTRTSKFQAAPGGLDRECVGQYSVNCASIQPKFQFSQRATLGWENFDVSLLWRYIHGVRFEDQQLQDDLAAAIDGGCTGILAAADVNSADPDGCLVNPEFRNLGAAHYFDVTTRFIPSEHLTLTFTVKNLFDRKPKGVGSTVGSTSFNSGNVYPSTYDALGRRFGVNAKINF